MAKTIVELNPDRCVCCYACVAACQDLHYNVDETGPALRRALRQEDAAGTIRCGSIGCMHCETAACLTVCPTGAIRRDPETGLVVTESSLCVGCRRCRKACPYGVPQFTADKRRRSMQPWAGAGVRQNLPLRGAVPTGAGRARPLRPPAAAAVRKSGNSISHC